MKDIAIFGAGGLGREIYLLIKKLNQKKNEWNLIGFFDDSESLDLVGSTIPVKHLGSTRELNEYPQELALVIAVGTPDVIETVFRKIKNTNIYYPNIIANDSIIYDENMVLGQGNVITSGCIFTDNVTIGNFNVFNLKTSVGHDVKIGNFNVFSPNVAVSGKVSIDSNNFFGLNSSIVQGKKIGSGNKIGASTLIIKNIKSNEFYFGVPGYKTDL